MPVVLSPEIERLVQQHMNDEEYRSTDDVLLAALHLLQQYQVHQRLRCDVKEGFDQIDRGEALELADDQSLRTFFDDIKARGRQRIVASRPA